MKKILLLLLLVSAFCQAQQAITMQNGTFTVATGDSFYDSGGPTANYMANEDYKITLCPSIPGTYVQLDFSGYNTEAAPRDIFTIYEGSNVDNEIIGIYGAVSPLSCLGGVITSSDPDGCLTITFQSDNSGQYFGWAAAISLVTVRGINEDLPLNSFCASGTKFCADTSVPFPNVTSNDCVPTSAGVVTENTCLLEAPNPVWHTIKIEQDGNLQLRIKQTTGPNGTGSQIDVDFALWGPYTDENAACGNLTPGNCSGDHNCSGNVVDCSFSLAGQETATITNAHAGEYYLLLVTNYEGASGYISMQQLNANAPGAGTTDCSVVCPQAAKTNPSKCGVADGYITLSGFHRNTFYNITYLYEGSPVAVTLRSTTLGKIILSGLEPGTYTNILTNYDDCNTPLGPIVLTETLPVLNSITAPTSVCNNTTATYTLTGTPNAEVTYTITGEPLPQTITLNASGTNTVVVNNITATTTLQATAIATGNSAVTGFAHSVSGGENPLTVIGNIAPTGTIATNLNAASINTTNATMLISLQHTVPAGTAITISMAKKIGNGRVSISNGVSNMPIAFNSGPANVLQRFVFTTTIATNKLIITRVNGSVWIDGVRYTYNPGLCSATINITKTVTVRPIITAPTVTTPVTYCRDATATALTASPLAGASLNWYLTNSPTETPTTAPIPATNVPGDVTFYVSQILNGCESARSAIVVQVNTAAVPPTVSNIPIEYCTNETAAALTATPSAGGVLHWYASNLPGSIELPAAPIPSTTIAGPQTFYVSQTLSDCESLKVPVLVIVNNILAAPIVVSPARYCIDAVAQPLTATTLPGATLNWFAADGTPLATAPLPDTSTATTTDFYVSQSRNGCESTRARIRVQVGLPTTAPVVISPLSYCQFSTAPALTATVASGATLNWYEQATSGTASDDPIVPSTADVGSISYYVSQTINGCESPRTEIVVNVSAAPVPPTVTAVLNFCQDQIPASLSAVALAGATLNWYGTNQTGGSASTTAPSILPNSAVYYVSQTFNGCESQRAAIAVTINARPLPPVANPVLYCEGETAVALQAQSIAGATLNWYGTNATGGTRSALAPIPQTATTQTYYVSQTVNGCESLRTAILVQIKSKPLPPTTAAVTYCNGESAAALTAIPSNGGSLHWYLSNNPSEVALSQAPIPSTNANGNQTFYVSQTIDGCESLRASIVVTTRTTALPIVIPSIAYCYNETASALTATALPGATLNWFTQINGTASATAPTPQTNIFTPQIFYVSQTINGCESPKAAIRVIVNRLPEPQLSDGIICLRESDNVVERTHLLNTGLSNATHQFIWTLNDQILPNQTATLEASEAGTYEVIAINRSTNCQSLPVQANVSVSFIGESISVTGDLAFADSQNYTVHVVGQGQYEYQLDYGPFQSSNVFTNVSAGSHTINVRDQNDCTNLSHSFSVMGYLRFFTPNGDGYNDVWSIPGIENDPTAKISVFDRYGKLMKIINIKDNSWDGTYAGKELPADDYWFLMEYTENQQRKEFRSHFSLKR